MRYISEVNGEFIGHEDPIFHFDAVKSFAETLSLADICTDNEVRFTGQNLCTIIRNNCQNQNLDLSKCYRIGLNDASNLSSEAKRTAALKSKDESIALYFHCIMHCFNLCISPSFNFAFIRNSIDVVDEILQH